MKQLQNYFGIAMVSGAKSNTSSRKVKKICFTKHVTEWVKYKYATRLHSKHDKIKSWASTSSFENTAQ